MKHLQQFGRALRTMPGKSEALIIDHVGNRDKRAKGTSDAIPLRACVQCYEPYERIYRECPHCGHYPEPESPANRDKRAKGTSDADAQRRGVVE